MLDDLKFIHAHDPQDALGVAEKQWQQLTHEFNVDFKPTAEIQNIVLAGMGGSAWPALFINNWLALPLPLEIVRDYSLPAYVNGKTLFISSSYSGNTEETLSALAEAEERGATIVVISSGGKLAQHAQAKNYPLFTIPSGIQPRMCSFYFLAAFAQLFNSLGLVHRDTGAELAQVAQWLNTQTAGWRPDVAAKDNRAKQIATELAGKSVIIYSGPKLFPAANKWRICMNENAKNLAWGNQYPEFNHNEFIGWSSHPTQKPFGVVEIRSNLEHERVQKRFGVTERLLSGLRPEPIVIEPLGDSLIQQLVWASVLGDFVSIYLALLNGVNPTPVELVEKFKKELG